MEERDKASAFGAMTTSGDLEVIKAGSSQQANADVKKDSAKKEESK